jgi:hypothetical protein
MMINHPEILAFEQFADWGEVYMQLVQKSDYEWVVEVSSFTDRGVSTKERLFLTKEYGPLRVEFIYDEWATDAQCLLEFAMKHIQ